MGADYKINKLYGEAVRKAASGQAQWKEVCKLRDSCTVMSLTTFS